MYTYRLKNQPFLRQCSFVDGKMFSIFAKTMRIPSSQLSQPISPVSSGQEVVQGKKLDRLLISCPDFPSSIVAGYWSRERECRKRELQKGLAGVNLIYRAEGDKCQSGMYGGLLLGQGPLISACMLKISNNIFTAAFEDEKEITKHFPPPLLFFPLTNFVLIPSLCSEKRLMLKCKYLPPVVRRKWRRIFSSLRAFGISSFA